MSRNALPAGKPRPLSQSSSIHDLKAMLRKRYNIPPSTKNGYTPTSGRRSTRSAHATPTPTIKENQILLNDIDAATDTTENDQSTANQSKFSFPVRAESKSIRPKRPAHPPLLEEKSLQFETENTTEESDNKSQPTNNGTTMQSQSQPRFEGSDPTSNVSTPISTRDTPIAFRFPLEFPFSKHLFLFIDNSKDRRVQVMKEKYLELFHTALEPFRETLFERYSWYPAKKNRIEIDRDTKFIGFALNPNNWDEVQGCITVFACDTTDERFEISLTILPSYQRQHLATDLVRLTWSLFFASDKYEWIYVMNSTKSSLFWRTIRQWYPEINFKLVRP